MSTSTSSSGSPTSGSSAGASRAAREPTFAGALLARPRLRRASLLALLLGATLALLALSLPQAAGLPAAAADRSGLALRILPGRPATVAIQVGHLDAHLHPPELARLRSSTGGHAAGIDEVEVNRAVAEALAQRLTRHGVTAVLVPATVPRGLRADAVIALHADSNESPVRRGYKSAVFDGRRNRWDASLKAHIDRTYLAGSGLPDDDANVSGAMLRYYAFNRRYRHSVARDIPAVIVELGYLSNPEDRRFLTDPQGPAALLEEAVVAFLRERGRLAP